MAVNQELVDVLVNKLNEYLMKSNEDFERVSASDPLVGVEIIRSRGVFKEDFRVGRITP